MTLINVIIGNALVIYLVRSRLVVLTDRVKPWLILIQYYFALIWMTDGWLAMEISVSRPLHHCMFPNKLIFSLYDLIVIFHALQAWRMFMLAGSRRKTFYTDHRISKYSAL